MQSMGSEQDERWSQLLDGGLDDGGRHELLAVAAAELNRAVADRGGDCRGLLDAIGAVTDQAVTDQLWEDANRGFELALGPSSARLINWLVLDSGVPARLAVVRPMLEPAAARMAVLLGWPPERAASECAAVRARLAADLAFRTEEEP